MVRVYLGLGSNLDNPERQLERACEELAVLPQSRLVSRSSLYRSAPMGPEDQPDYLNAVVCLETALEPERLLDHLLRIEQAHARVRTRHWGPRTLDLDILLYGDEKIDSERLQVPHPGLADRNFVLYPLAEIAADLSIPGYGSLRVLLENCPERGLVRVDALAAST